MLTQLQAFVAGMICSLAVISPQLDGEIAEINEIESIMNYLEKDSLFFLNVGDTLFSPSCMLADNQWREYFVERANHLISEPVIAQRIIDKVKGLIVEKVPKITPEEITPQFISQMQSEEISVFGYTQRNFSTSYAKNNGLITYNHLLGMGIDLKKTQSFDSIKDYHNTFHVFQFGILFTNKNPLGPAFAEFIATRKEKPSKIIIVDDSLEALQEVENILGNSDYLGLRYGRIDERKNAFDPHIATIQFFAFINENRLLTDNEAIQIRKDNPETDYCVALDAWIRAEQ